MYHSLLNSLFSWSAKSSKKSATVLVDSYVSKVGVNRFLNRRMDENTEARLNAFNGILNQKLNKDNEIKNRINLRDLIYKILYFILNGGKLKRRKEIYI